MASRARPATAAAAGSPGSRWSYSRSSAPQPAAFETTQSAPVVESVRARRRARASARSRAPRWSGSAPQHPWSRGTTTRTPARRSSAAVAWLVSAKSVSATQPVTSTAVPRATPSGSRTGGSAPRRRRGSAAAKASQPRVHGTPATSRAGARSARRSQGVVSAAASTRRAMRARAGRCRSIHGRAASMSAPYGTPDGHAVSQARQPRHRSRCRITSGDASRRPSSRPRMRWMRPRGESASVPSSRYVGHADWQRPQCTQVSSFSVSTKRIAGAPTGCCIRSRPWHRAARRRKCPPDASVRRRPARARIASPRRARCGARRGAGARRRRGRRRARRAARCGDRRAPRSAARRCTVRAPAR